MSIISPFPFLQFSLFITPVNCYCRSNTPSNSALATLQFNSFNYGFFIYIYTIKGGRDTALEAKAQLYSDNIA